MKKVGNVKDLKDTMCVSVGFKKLALYKIKNKVYCTENKCSHLWGPLCNGELNKDIITCPWHGSKFDVKTGKVVSGPAKKDIKSYKVEIKGDEIFVKI